MLIVDCGIMSPTPNVNPNLVVIPCKQNEGIIYLQYCHLPSDFPSRIQSSMTFISSQVANKRMEGFGQWTHSSIIHDNICSITHKKCHHKSYHNDIKYHIILLIIFSFGCRFGWYFSTNLYGTGFWHKFFLLQKMMQFHACKIVVIFQILQNLRITNCPCKLYKAYALRGTNMSVSMRAINREVMI